MSTDPTLEARLATLETRFDDLRAHVIDPPAPHWTRRLLTWQALSNLMALVAIPAAFFGAWTVINDQVLRADEIEQRERMAVAIDQLAELQDFNADVYVQQARQDGDAAFALLDAKRGRVERLVRDVHATWQDYPRAFTRSELTTLAEALVTVDRNDQALAVADSVDEGLMTPIWQGDMDILRARILFARGPAQDPEAARDAFRAALTHAQDVGDPGVSAGLIEKYAAVRLVNELWLGTDCADLTAFAGLLGDAMADGTRPDRADAVRRNTYAVMEAHGRLCPDG